MTKWILGVMTLIVFSAFSANAQQRQMTMQHRMDRSGMMMNCPMNVAGADVAVENTQEGAAITFTTKSGDVNELRSRVERMAKMHETRQAGETGPTEQQGRGSMHRGVMMIPSEVQYEAVPNGARLLFTPKDPAQLEELRTRIRQHADRFRNGDCSMMQDMMHGMMAPKAAPPPASKP